MNHSNCVHIVHAQIFTQPLGSCRGDVCLEKRLELPFFINKDLSLRFEDFDNDAGYVWNENIENLVFCVRECVMRVYLSPDERFRNYLKDHTLKDPKLQDLKGLEYLKTIVEEYRSVGYEMKTNFPDWR
jgi:hypothetical protein